MQCQELLVQGLSLGMILGGVMHFVCLVKSHAAYGRYVDASTSSVMVPARLAWFLQELPALLVPLLLLLMADGNQGFKGHLMLWMFCLHYFQRSCIYSLLMKGRPYPFIIMLSGMVFCSINGFLQAHYLLHCATYQDLWFSDGHFIAGLIIFFIGMGINIHSDHILRNLRKPGEVSYKIPKGGLFQYVSGANYFGEIVEWLGYALASWSLPTFAFAFFTICFIGPRAYHHHRFYIEKFKDFPRSRRSLVPFIF
ncbi:3-oxo-5-alpha-steroid 4-dehydrogenase 2b [Triplophysa rosa]|uniref:3-oxo-5alpha-steroid 4-dehydrogenase (NADP(+)) n=1 Tax=Triplophysa rosa TaxID=992332 RepID=A0A9W7WP95_TRIRA|nr:3-oxo-5-alpha-steroid 4-dehydrogenase 2b [Triplophysa rosa]KAI7805805.1 putative steroid-5-alpha-reductase [Triplophysa rosa]